MNADILKWTLREIKTPNQNPKIEIKIKSSNTRTTMNIDH